MTVWPPWDLTKSLTGDSEATFKLFKPRKFLGSLEWSYLESKAAEAEVDEDWDEAIFLKEKKTKDQGISNELEYEIL